MKLNRKSLKTTEKHLPSHGLIGDDGKICDKGAYGPYKQSQRGPIYQTFAKQLVREGKAYPCFTTEEELEALAESISIHGIIQPLTGMAMNAYSRFAEYRADRQAVQEGYGEAMVTALKKLARENFSHLAPSPSTYSWNTAIRP